MITMTLGLTIGLIRVAQPSDMIQGRNTELEDMLHDQRWAIESIRMTKNPRNGKDIPHYLLRIGKGRPHLAFVSHWDVVPYGDGWAHSPSLARVENGVVYGRGACDMLGAVASQLFAGRDIAAHGGTVSIFLAGDEETDCCGMPALLEANSLPVDYAIGGEPTSTTRAGDTIKIGRRGVIQGDIILHGDQVHSAYVGAAKDANLSQKLFDGGLSHLIGSYDSGEGEIPPTTVAIAGIDFANAGRTYNSVPGMMRVMFDARVSTQWTRGTFIGELGSRLKKTGLPYELDIKKVCDPYLTKNDDLRTIVTEAITNVTGEAPDVNCKGGTSDCRFFAARGIPVLEIGLENSTIHRVNECQSVENLELMTEIYREIGGQLVKGYHARPQ